MSLPYISPYSVEFVQSEIIRHVSALVLRAEMPVPVDANILYIMRSLYVLPEFDRLHAHLKPITVLAAQSITAPSATIAFQR
jgi:hypothetical protein